MPNLLDIITKEMTLGNYSGKTIKAYSAVYKDIYKKFKRPLRDITEDELKLVKNYLLGTFLRSVDGPFAMADRFKGIMEYNLGYDYFDRYIATIRNVSASELQSLAIKYFDKDSMIELVVGKK